jgi:hypothetical protein
LVTAFFHNLFNNVYPSWQCTPLCLHSL